MSALRSMPLSMNWVRHPAHVSELETVSAQFAPAVQAAQDGCKQGFDGNQVEKLAIAEALQNNKAEVTEGNGNAPEFESQQGGEQLHALEQGPIGDHFGRER